MTQLAKTFIIGDSGRSCKARYRITRVISLLGVYRTIVLAGTPWLFIKCKAARWAAVHACASFLVVNSCS